MRIAMRARIASSAVMAGAMSCYALSGVVAQVIPKPVLVTPLKLKDLPGRWVGIGNMAFRDGTSEKLNCRITYRIRRHKNLVQNIWCKNTSMRLEIKTKIVDRGGKISGFWNDRIYSMSGTLEGRRHGNQIKAALTSTFFNARLNIMIIGTRQTIQVTPHDGRLQSMRISLARG